MRLFVCLFAGVSVGIGSYAFTGESDRHSLFYSASRSSEAVITFDHQVEFSARVKPDLELAREKIHQQVLHLFGSMAEATTKAVPKGNERITRVSVLQKPGTRTHWIARYSYEGTIVLENDRSSIYEVVLPRNPDRIYRSGLELDRRGNPVNRCTDEHYQSEGDFWYFWSPDKPGCPLIEGVHYDRVASSVRRLENSVRTYPEYDRLADPSGRIRISILMGMDDPRFSKNPQVSADLNAENYRAIRRSLIEEQRYSVRRLSPGEVRTTTGLDQPVAYVERFSRQAKRARIEVTLFFGPSGIDEDSAAFHHFYRDAIENASVLIYDGHSGLGGHLDLESIEELQGFGIRPNRERYQIYYFNSCSSYTYYNSMYFGRKRSAEDPKGTRNLDILTNGLATYFSVLGESDLVLVKAIDRWADGGLARSYQALAGEIDSDNLFGVNGDEDNPAVAPR